MREKIIYIHIEKNNRRKKSITNSSSMPRSLTIFIYMYILENWLFDFEFYIRNKF